MKTRMCLILLGVMVIWAVCGCQKSVAKTDTGAALQEPAAKTGDADKPQQRYTTQRHRNPETGRIETRRVPVEATAKKEKPCEEEAAAPPKPEKPDVAGKSKPPQPLEFSVRWEENCSVRKAFEASAWVLEDLGLAQGLTDYTTQRVRDPRGRIQTRRVPENSRGARSDGLSAFLEGNATAEIKFVVRILLVPPELSSITIEATSMTQPEAVLEQQSLFLKEKISEAIAAEPEPQAVPYPETMMLDCGVQPAADAIFSWADRQGFKRNSSGERDHYYREVTCETGSGIRFNFTLRLVEPEHIRLDIEASYYEGKDEFGMIVRNLMETLESINAQSPQAAKEQKPYPEMLMLNHSVDHVAGVLGAWINNKGFSPDQITGDSFYRYVGCKTGSGVRLRFYMRLIDTETTKLHIYISDYERKEEFPMILKSLQETLDGLTESTPVVTETGG